MPKPLTNEEKDKKAKEEDRKKRVSPTGFAVAVPKQNTVLIS